jgi:hypothetical protein
MVVSATYGPIYPANNRANSRALASHPEETGIHDRHRIRCYYLPLRLPDENMDLSLPMSSLLPKWVCFLAPKGCGPTLFEVSDNYM